MERDNEEPKSISEQFMNMQRRQRMAASARTLAIEGFIAGLDLESLQALREITEEIASYPERGQYYLGVVETTLFSQYPNLCRGCGIDHGGNGLDPHAPFVAEF